MNELIEAFNRINKYFGANRVVLEDISFSYDRLCAIQITIEGFGKFYFDTDGDNFQAFDEFWETTDASGFVRAIGQGMVRDAEGSMVNK